MQERTDIISSLKYSCQTNQLSIENYKRKLQLLLRAASCSQKAIYCNNIWKESFLCYMYIPFFVSRKVYSRGKYKEKETAYESYVHMNTVLWNIQKDGGIPYLSTKFYCLVQYMIVIKYKFIIFGCPKQL